MTQNPDAVDIEAEERGACSDCWRAHTSGLRACCAEHPPENPKLGHFRHELNTWWWGRDRDDGRTMLFPRMTLESLNGDLPNGVVPTLFRCVRCKIEGSAEALNKTLCVDSTWYHGDIREYRKHYMPMRCLDKDALDGLPCCNEWVVAHANGLVGPQCPQCGSSNTEEIQS